MSNGAANEIGDLVAAGHCDGATPPVLTQSFGVASLARSAKGLFTATLFNQIDPRTCVVEAQSTTNPNTVNCPGVGTDTASVKNFHVVDAAGADADGGFDFQIRRTKFTP